MMHITRRDRTKHRLRLAAGACVGLALILVLAGVALGRNSPQASPVTTTTLPPVRVVVTLPPSTTTTNTPTTRPPTLLQRTHAAKGHLAVQSTAKGVTVYASPGYEAPVVKHFPPTGQFGAQTTFLVVAQTRSGPGGGSYQVLLPQRPNGGTGWVRTADVEPVELPYAVRISLSAHRLDLYEQGELRASYPVAVGKRGTLTPTGDFYMVSKGRPSRTGGPYGVLAIGLSAYSDTLTDWVGGGQVAIHGTNEPGKIGTDASHGCVRMNNEDVLKLGALAPIGTPVTITP
jgi:lipoprotein-anchoring transpeptidase ErfK/SrfK